MSLIVLRSYDNYIAANMAKNLLESNEINCFLQDEIVSTIIPLWNIANGGIKLLVQTEDLAQAEVIIEEMEAAEQSDKTRS